MEDKLKKDLSLAIESAKDIDYHTDEEGNEYPVEVFNSEFALEQVLKVLEEHKLINLSHTQQ